MMRNAFATFVDAIARLNTVVVEQRDGARIYKKKRALHAPIVIAVGEAFLRASDARITMFARPSLWRAWEIYCARLLFEREDAAWSEGEWLCLRAMPGTSLRALEAQGLLSVDAVAAGARAMKRAHAKHCTHFNAPWSHGDPHMGNIVVDLAAGAFGGDGGGSGTLVDFETRHTRGSAAERHADDLSTFVFDLIALDHDDAWRAERIGALLHAYGPSKEVRAALRARLVPRSGIPGVLVATRTHHLDAKELARRIEAV